MCKKLLFKTVGTKIVKYNKLIQKGNYYNIRKCDECGKEFKAENKAETDEFEKAQKIRIEEEKSVLKNEAKNSKEELNKGSAEISKIIVDKVLGV